MKHFVPTSYFKLSNVLVESIFIASVESVSQAYRSKSEDAETLTE
jgi:hypothetical protein